MQFMLVREMNHHYDGEDSEGGPNKRVGTLDAFAAAVRTHRVNVETWTRELAAMGDQRAALQVRMMSLAHRDPGSRRFPVGRARANPVTNRIDMIHMPEVQGLSTDIGNLGGRIQQYEQAITEERLALAKASQKLLRQGVRLENDGTIDWTSVPTPVVTYLTAQEQRYAYQIHFKEGLMYRHTPGPHGQTIPELFDTGRRVTAFGGGNFAIYVMSTNGDLFAHSHSVGSFHHSSFMAGKPVACAGEIRVLRGQLAYVSNKSGHYWPTAAHMLQMLEMLRRAGVRDQYKVELMNTGGAGIYANREACIQALASCGHDLDYIRLLAYWRYIADGVTLAAAGLRWAAPGEPSGIYNGTLICRHREARKWFKAQGMMPETWQN